MKETMMDKNRMKYSIGVYSPKPQVKNDVCSVLHTNRYAITTQARFICVVQKWAIPLAN